LLLSLLLLSLLLLSLLLRLLLSLLLLRLCLRKNTKPNDGALAKLAVASRVNRVLRLRVGKNFHWELIHILRVLMLRVLRVLML
jgi:hypothetical protein